MWIPRVNLKNHEPQFKFAGGLGADLVQHKGAAGCLRHYRV